MIKSLRAVLLAASVLTPGVAMAQDAAASAEDEGGIEDIVVTARLTQESLADAPVSVSVVTGDQIQELGLNSIDDFARNATGISFSQAFGRTTDRPVIRGQSNVLAGVQAGVETGAAYFVDGVYYQGDIQGFDPLSIERVEIIKGPQSALYGRNTYAGAINYITRDPGNEFAVTGRARIANHSEYEAAGSISGPVIADVLSFRLGGRYYSYGGEYTNQLTQRRVGDEETRSAYLTTVFRPFDGMTWRTRLYYQRDNDGPLALFLQGAAENNCRPGFRSPAFRTASPFVPGAPAILTSNNNNQYFCGVIRARPNNIQLNTDPIQVSPTLGLRDGTAYDGVLNRQWGFSNVIDLELGNSGWRLTSLTGYRRNTNLFGTDSDHSNAFAYFGPIPAANTDPEPAFANTNRDEQRDFSQELRLSSPEDQPVRFVLGGYYFTQRFESTDITFASGPAGLALGTNGSQYATIRNRAVFGLVEWDITDALQVVGELRYAEEIKTLLDRSSATSIFCAGEQDSASLFGFNGTCQPRGRFTGWDPRITVNYTTPGGTLIYGVFATGRKPGGFNGTAGVTATAQTGTNLVTYEPEQSRGGEIGIKFDALDRTLRVSLAAFYNDLSNVQLTQSIANPTSPTALTSVVNSVGDAETTGFELEITAAPTDGLLFNFGVSYVDARFTSGCDADQFILNSGGLRPNFDTRNPTPAGLALCDISGNRLPLGSPWIISGSVNIERPVNDSGLSWFANANFSAEASKFVQVHNLAETGDTFLANARIGIRTPRFSIAVFGRNLTDEDSIPLATRWFDLRYGAGTRGLPPAATVTFDGRPAVIETGSPRGFFGSLRRGRTVGIEATVNF
jgi:outer membrane receptor protein involved in Fe transport